jgi:CheY-like chemotaxis protein
MPNYADHILVASPSSVVRQRVLDGLRSPTRQVEQASGGAEALDHLEHGLWQVLFLDRSLPDLNTEELSQIIRQRFPNVEIVLLDSEADQIAVPQHELPLLPGHVLPSDLEPIPARVAVVDAILQAPLPGMIGGRGRCSLCIAEHVCCRGATRRC